MIGNHTHERSKSSHLVVPFAEQVKSKNKHCRQLQSRIGKCMFENQTPSPLKNTTMWRKSLYRSVAAACSVYASSRVYEYLHFGTNSLTNGESPMWALMPVCYGDEKTSVEPLGMLVKLNIIGILSFF
jgi:hypothetical protein